MLCDDLGELGGESFGGATVKELVKDFNAKNPGIEVVEKYNPDIKLINRMKTPDKDASALKKFWNWAKHTAIKSSDELRTTKEKNLRTICQIGNIAFSLVSLGLLIPIYTRSKTNKKHAEELAKLNAEQKSAANAATSSGNTSYTGTGTTSSTGAGTDVSKQFLEEKTAFKQILNS